MRKAVGKSQQERRIYVVTKAIMSVTNMYTNRIIVLSVVSPDSQSIFNEYNIDFKLSKIVFCSKRLRLGLSANCFQNTFVRLPTRR